jgi:hypothetical protein
VRELRFRGEPRDLFLPALGASVVADEHRAGPDQHRAEQGMHGEGNDERGAESAPLLVPMRRRT